MAASTAIESSFDASKSNVKLFIDNNRFHSAFVIQLITNSNNSFLMPLIR